MHSGELILCRWKWKRSKKWKSSKKTTEAAPPPPPPPPVLHSRHNFRPNYCGHKSCIHLSRCVGMYSEERASKLARKEQSARKGPSFITQLPLVWFMRVTREECTEQAAPDPTPARVLYKTTLLRGLESGRRRLESKFLMQTLSNAFLHLPRGLSKLRHWERREGKREKKVSHFSSHQKPSYSLIHFSAPGLKLIGNDKLSSFINLQLKRKEMEGMIFGWIYFKN